MIEWRKTNASIDNSEQMLVEARTFLEDCHTRIFNGNKKNQNKKDFYDKYIPKLEQQFKKAMDIVNDFLSFIFANK